MSRPRLWRVVPGLGIAQIISWGTLYYSIGVLGAPMRADLAISEAMLFGAYSFSLLLAGLCAPAVGRAIDRWGGRAVLATGSAVAALALFAIGQVHSIAELYAAWALAGAAMALTLYEPAFATLSQHSGASYRKALTALTLLGGLASTVFWPASLAGLEALGWRHTMVAFALLQCAVCLPLHLLCIPRLSEGETGAASVLPSAFAPALPGVPLAVPRGGSSRNTPRARSRGAHAGRRTFVALASAFALNGFVVSAVAVHLIAVLQGKHFSLAGAVWVASFIGPMQVAGRLAEFAFGRRFSSRTVGLLALAGVALAVMLLLMLDGAVALGLAFAALYGASNGVLTIVRGLVPAELFGRAAYGTTLGNLAAPSLIARAIAPLACAGLALPGTQSVAWLLALALISVIAIVTFGWAIARR